jgi:Family of unknown function (DUF6519)
MQGDFSRLTLDSPYTRVLLQQGRPLLDADWNEQAAILLNQIRTLARGLYGSNSSMTQRTRKTSSSQQEPISLMALPVISMRPVTTPAKI